VTFSSATDVGDQLFPKQRNILLSTHIYKDYKTILYSEVSVWIAGISIAVIALLLFIWQAPWGVAGGYRNWGDWLFYFTGIYSSKPQYPWLSGISITNFGIFSGALVSSFLNNQFRFQWTNGPEYLKALVGGVLMGCGAAFSRGCNVGGFYTAIGMFSAGGYIMMIGLTIGSYFGLRFLIWEMEIDSPNRKIIPSNGLFNSVTEHPILLNAIGIIIIFTLLIMANSYSNSGHTIEGGQILFGFFLGIVLHRSRFCFVRGFRDPIMTGDTQMVKAIALSLLVYGIGAAVIKWLYVQPAEMGVYHPFLLGSFIGGILFGVGMVIAGGCATSVLWRLGEGNVKMLLALVSFSISNSISGHLLKKYNIYHHLGKGVFLPGKIGWQFSLALFISALFFWVILARWNEVNDKFIVT
jgi:uncharacterized membrane protein YedE/YeeE